MSLFNTARKFASGPQGRRLLQQARALNTAENREKAMAMARRVRGGGPPKRPGPPPPR